MEGTLFLFTILLVVLCLYIKDKRNYIKDREKEGVL